jgi:N-formylmaleamate deformylase
MSTAQPISRHTCVSLVSPRGGIHSLGMTTTDLNAPPVEFIDLSGYRMAYRQWGSSERTDAILLVHGITSSSLSWIRVAPRLAQHTRIIAIDLKGHGDSDQPARGYRLTDQAEEVANLARSLGLRQVRLIGHSWGGAISVLLASSSGLPLERVVLEDPAIAVSAPEHRQEAMRNYVASVGLSREEAERRVTSNASPGWTEEDIQGKIDSSVKTSPKSVQTVFDENGGWDVTPDLERVSVPTLLVRAEVERGGIVGESVLEAIRANRNIQTVTIPGADHNIHRGEFDAFMAAVEPFLAAA